MSLDIPWGEFKYLFTSLLIPKIKHHYPACCLCNYYIAKSLPRLLQHVNDYRCFHMLLGYNRAHISVIPCLPQVLFQIQNGFPRCHLSSGTGTTHGFAAHTSSQRSCPRASTGKAEKGNSIYHTFTYNLHFMWMLPVGAAPVAACMHHFPTQEENSFDHPYSLHRVNFGSLEQ